MADFNPQIQPSRDPDYLHYSRVVEAPPADVSKSIALKTVGEGISGAASIADTYIKETAKSKAVQGATDINDIWSRALQAGIAGQQQRVMPQQTTTGQTESLLDSNAQMDVP